MRKLVLAIIGILFISTSAFALDQTQIKLYVEKHYQITKKLKSIKTLQKDREAAVKAIQAKYNYSAMMAEIKTVYDLYNPQIDTLQVDYQNLVDELEKQ